MRITPQKWWAKRRRRRLHSWPLRWPRRRHLRSRSRRSTFQRRPSEILRSSGAQKKRWFLKKNWMLFPTGGNFRVGICLGCYGIYICILYSQFLGGGRSWEEGEGSIWYLAYEILWNSIFPTFGKSKIRRGIFWWLHEPISSRYLEGRLVVRMMENQFTENPIPLILSTSILLLCPILGGRD